MASYAFDRRFKQIGITERDIQYCFQSTVSSQWNDPVSENTVMDALILKLCGQFPFGDGVDFRKILLEQFPMAQYLNGQVGQPHVAERDQIFIVPFLHLVERCFGESQEDDTGIECHILRRLVLSA